MIQYYCLKMIHSLVTTVGIGNGLIVRSCGIMLMYATLGVARSLLAQEEV